MALALRATPPVTDGDDTAAIHVAAAEARTSQADASDAVAAVIDALPQETRDGLAAVITGADKAERISPDDIGELQQAQLFVPRTVAPGAFPFLPQLYIPTERELAQMGEELSAFFEDLPPILVPRLGLLFGLGTILGTDENDGNDEGDDEADRESRDSGGREIVPGNGPPQNTRPPRQQRPNPPLLQPRVGQEDGDASNEPVGFNALTRDVQLDQLADGTWVFDQEAYQALGVGDRSSVRTLLEGTLQEPDLQRELPGDSVAHIQYLRRNEAVVVVTDKSGALQEAGAFLGEDAPHDLLGLRERQADHAWVRHAFEFEKRGIQTRDHLRDLIAEAREAPLDLTFLKRGRTMFGKLLDDKHGLVIIDNPLTRDGDTVFYTRNLQNRLKKLKANDI